MSRSTIHDLPPRFIWVAAMIATAFAAIGTLIIAGAGPTPLGRVMAVLVGFLLLGAGAVVALAIAVRDDTWHGANDDSPW